MIKSPIKLSIITITFNSDRYLEETIQSVLSQDCPDLEYIIIDGGSTDGTIAIIRKHAEKDRRIRWISEPDRGISDAFNKGIALASGDVIGIINSDDTYASGALQAVADAYARQPGCDVFYGDMLRFQGDRPLFLIKPTDVQRHVWREMPVNHPATFITRRAYEKNGVYDVDLKIAMDYDLILRLYMNGSRFHYLERVLANMRYGGESDERFLAGHREVLQIVLKGGYPPCKAYGWFAWKVAKSICKNALKRLGLTAVIRLHPRFGKISRP